MSELGLSEITVKRKLQANCQIVDKVEKQNVSAFGCNIGEVKHVALFSSPVATPGSSPGPGTSSPTLYYGINIPCDLTDNPYNDFPLVYTDKLEVLNVLKLHKKARFKVFKTQQQALEFACYGNISYATVLENSENKSRSNSSSVGEKPSLFKGPKAQDMVKLRKSIECGDLNTVRGLVWENPRYLVSSGDTPAILQEGSRYNALHVSAKAKNASIAEFILQTVGDPKFVGLLYGDDNSVQTDDRIKILLDLYLNTPDKGLNETPLHFAVKYGALKVVEILTTCAQCVKEPKNKYGQTPKDIVCSRVNSQDASLKEEIMSLLDGHFYVPVLRSGDNTIQPTVGKPFSPITCCPELSENPLDTRVEIRAYAGPMSQEQADLFHKKWKTPPRVRREALNPWRLADSEKGLEREGRDLAQQLNVGWKEYWAFLDTFVDFTSTEGLCVLEKYLQKRNFPEACNDNEDVVLGKVDLVESEPPIAPSNSPICDKVSKYPQSPVSPMTDLCLSLQACTLSSPEVHHGRSTRVVASCKTPAGEKVDSNGLINQEEEAFLGVLSNPGLSPFLYVDKSCQVFGKRIADGLTHIAVNESPNSVDAVLDFLKQEMKHLQILVCSYKNDARFVSVDFHFVHSRIASIVRVHFTNLLPEEIDPLCDLSTCVLNSLNLQTSSDDEDLNVNPNMYRNQVGLDKKKITDRELMRLHVKCVSHHVLSDLKSVVGSSHSEKLHYQTEEECIKSWAEAVKCCCPWPSESFVRNSRKRSSYNRIKYFARNDFPQGKYDNADQDGRQPRGEEDVPSSRSEEKTSNVGASNPNGPGRDSEGPTEESDAEEDEEFFSAESSPASSSCDEDSAEEMETPDEGEVVFIEGGVPSQVDVSVLRALDHVDVSSADHPHVYRWRHSLRLHLGRGGELAHYPTTPPRGGHKPRMQTAYSFSLQDNWHNVVPPSSPLSPQFNRTLGRRRIL